MLELYLTGYIIAVMIGLIKIVVQFFLRNSVRARNMAKIGFRFDPMTGQFVPPGETTSSSWWFAIWVLIITPPFSWLTLTSTALALLYVKLFNNPPPEKLKEIQYRVANVDLPEQEMRQIMKKTEHFLLTGQWDEDERRGA